MIQWWQQLSTSIFNKKSSTTKNHFGSVVFIVVDNMWQPVARDIIIHIIIHYTSISWGKVIQWGPMKLKLCKEYQLCIFIGFTHKRCDFTGTKTLEGEAVACSWLSAPVKPASSGDFNTPPSFPSSTSCLLHWPPAFVAGIEQPTFTFSGSGSPKCWWHGELLQGRDFFLVRELSLQRQASHSLWISQRQSRTSRRMEWPFCR